MHTITIHGGTTMRFVTMIGLATIVLACMVWPSEASDYNRAQGQQSDFHWRGRIASGRAIEIKGVNGNVRAEATSSNEVEVTAVKRGRRSDPAEVEIRVVEHAGGVTICAVYPSDDPDRPNECRPGKGGRMSVHDNDVSVHFTVRVPWGIRFIGRTVNGKIEAVSLTDLVEAYTVNGNIRISTAAYAEAKTVNGSITASLGSSNWTDSLEFGTVNGDVTAEFSTDLNAELEAETVNGDITVDYPVTVRGRINPRRLTGTIGSGGRELTLKTVNGNIRLRSRAV